MNSKNKFVIRVSEEEIARVAQKYESTRAMFGALPHAEEKVWTIEDVIQYAEELIGWEKDQTLRFIRSTRFFWRENLQKNVFDGSYNDWCTATGLLRMVYYNLHDGKPRPRALPKSCPICDGPVTPAPKRNGMYGWEYGWTCANGDHFTECVWLPILGRYKQENEQ
jgi:hypothetical protein